MMSSPMKILLVDDESMCHMAIKSFAKKFGIEIDSAKNGVEALDKMKTNNNYNLILMDMLMPEMDGKKATQEIRKLPEGLSQLIVAMSADEMSEDDVKLYQFNSFIQKPINKTKFESLMNQFKS